MSGPGTSADDSAAEARLGDIRRLLARGEALEAYDRAQALLGRLEGLPLVEARYLAALAAARGGAAGRAGQLIDELQPTSDVLAGQLGEDVAGLKARLAKDEALAATGHRRAAGLRTAAAMYEAAYERYRQPYACINAATMWLLVDDRDRAEALARAAAELATGDDYWAAATRAEAALVLGRLDAATRALEEADRVSRGDWSTRATTTRQLSLICAASDLDPGVLAPLSNPTVFHFCGHRLDDLGSPTSRFPAEHEAEITGRVAAVISDERLGIGFGALASGADLIVAEQLLAAGGELHVVLPFGVDEFVESSVAPSGPDWVGRFEACVADAASFRLATDGQFLDDPVMFDFGARVAMGDALNRARELATRVVQLAVWDGVDAREGAVTGTAVDVSRWRTHGGETLVVDLPGGGSSPVDGTRPGAESHPSRPRSVRALLFADVAGFSQLGDRELPVFDAEVMGRFAAVIDSLGGSVLVRRTWGDGIHLVLDGVVPAARCALGLVDAMGGLDLDSMGLGATRGLRVGVHVGPVFDGVDRITGQYAVTGADVTRTARIEPRTPEGQVYATHPFAALLALSGADDLRCEYVGRLPTAKDYGILPMYRVVASPSG